MSSTKKNNMSLAAAIDDPKSFRGIRASPIDDPKAFRTNTCAIFCTDFSIEKNDFFNQIL